jgi:hypothetical protein
MSFSVRASTRAARLGAPLLAAGLLALVAATGSARAAALPNLTLTIGPSSIAVGGATQSGAVNVVTTATGVKEANAILFALKPGASATELISYVEKKNNDPNGASRFGSIVFDAESTPGPANEAQTLLAPGQYVAIFIEGEGKLKAHTAFTVTQAAAPAALPAPEATVRSIDFAFRGPSTLRDGELVRFENEGFLVHMDIAFPVKNKAAAAKLAKGMREGKEHQVFNLISGPPVAFAGPLSSGAFQQETITAKPGWYVQACFMETQDKRDHTLLGMERVIHIAK